MESMGINETKRITRSGCDRVVERERELLRGFVV